MAASITPQAEEVERKTGCFVPNKFLQPRMDLAVESFESVAAVADHRPRESGHGFLRNLDRAGREELVVWNHGRTSNVQALNVQR